jgi:hypothetical protein
VPPQGYSPAPAPRHGSGVGSTPGQGYSGPAVPPQGYGSGPLPQRGYGSGQLPSQDQGSSPRLPEGYSGNPVPRQGYSTEPAPRQGYGTEPAPRRGRRRHAAGGGHDLAGQPGGPAEATASAASPRRGPAHGYPPRPGDPGPRYPQGQFAAWNEAPAAPQPSAEPSTPLMASAPTWADTAETDLPSPADGGGVALAERPGDPGGHALLDRPGGFGDRSLGQRPGRFGDYSGDGADELAGGFASLAARTARAPVITDTPEYGRGTETADPDRDGAPIRRSRTRTDPARDAAAARRSRAAEAKERNAARRKGRKRRRVLLAGVCVPAVAAVAALAYLHHPWTGAKAGTKQPASLSSPTASPAHSSAKSLGQWQHIGTRAEDRTPLTLSQLFPAQFPAAGGKYTQTAQLAGTDCSKAVFGARLRSAVRKHSCSQVMRASYLSSGQKLMGTIGVLNLGTSADASAVGKVTGSGEFIAQLAAHHGLTRKLTKGTGLEEAEVKGHYLIMTWVEFTTLHAPKTAAQKTELKTFSADLINQTANVSLTSRMVTGSPQMP